MHVTLEILSGPRAGRKTRLGAGQELRVGRTEWADFAVPEDSHLSGVHFAVFADANACYLEDLGSSNGTFVNGQAVSERIALRGGEEILAGQTRFALRVDAASQTPGAESRTAGAESPAAAPPTKPAVVAATVPRAPVAATYTVEPCDSGLTLCRGGIEQIAPADLAASLAAPHRLFLIVDFRKLGMARPPELVTASHLFDWLPPEAAEQVSPVVFGADECEAWRAIVEEAWGADGVICLFVRGDREALVHHLRRSLRAKTRREDAGGGMLGFCWPSVMSLLLAHGPPHLVDPLLEGIDAVLVELPDLPQTWQVFGRAKVADLLERAGLRRAEAADAAANLSATKNP